MRGKGARVLPRSVSVGITPAYAGKSRENSERVGSEWDHPRLCGEKGKFYRSTQRSAGSPPPMRGKVLSVPVRSVHKRITPAYAGKSNELRLYVEAPKDHPRLCGEKRPQPLQHCHGYGSPPPMRGKD